MNRVTIRGVTYPSQRAAAKHFGLNENAVNEALNRGSIDKFGLGRSQNNARKVTYQGITYLSTAEMARRLGIGYSAAQWMLVKDRNLKKSKSEYYW